MKKLKFENLLKLIFKFYVFFIRDHRISMNPGLEPILLDLGKLFLLPDEGSSRKLCEKLKFVGLTFHVCFEHVIFMVYF